MADKLDDNAEQLHDTPLWRAVNGMFKMALPPVLASTKAMMKGSLITDVKQLQNNYRNKNLFMMWMMYDRAVIYWHKNYLAKFHGGIETNVDLEKDLEVFKQSKSYQQMEDIKQIASTVCVGDPAYMSFLDSCMHVLKEQLAGELVQELNENGYVDLVDKRYYFKKNGVDNLSNVAMQKQNKG